MMLKFKKANFLTAVILILDFLIISLIIQMLSVDGVKAGYWYVILASSFFSCQIICAQMPYLMERKISWDGGIILLLFTTTVYNFSVSEILGGVQYDLSDGKINYINVIIILTFMTILYRISGKISITICSTNIFFSSWSYKSLLL